MRWGNKKRVRERIGWSYECAKTKLVISVVEHKYSVKYAPYAWCGGIVSLRFSPTHMPFRPRSQPLMT